MATSAEQLDSYKAFQARVLESLEEIEGEAAADFHLQVAGHIQIEGVKHFMGGVSLKVPVGSQQVNEHEDGDYYEIEERVRHYLQQLDGKTRYQMRIINLSSGRGLTAQWTWNRGTVNMTEQEPRQSK